MKSMVKRKFLSFYELRHISTAVLIFQNGLSLNKNIKCFSSGGFYHGVYVRMQYE